MIFPYRSQNDWNETKLTRTRGFRYVVPVTSRYGPPFADLDPPPPHHTILSFKYRLHHIWQLILFASFLPMFFSITTQRSSIKVKKNSHFVSDSSAFLWRVEQYTKELNANKLLHSNY